MTPLLTFSSTSSVSKASSNTSSELPAVLLSWEGLSLSCPKIEDSKTKMLYSLFTLINQARLNAGKSTIGFVNPTLYANPSVLKLVALYAVSVSMLIHIRDVTIGGNQGCGTAGFSSAPGWDPVTGLGTPMFAKMQSLFMSLP